jgi:hypothetical protein
VATIFSVEQKEFTMTKYLYILFTLVFALHITPKNLIAALDHPFDTELATLDTQRIVGDVSLGSFSNINRLSRGALNEIYEKEHAQQIRLLLCKTCLLLFTDTLATINVADEANVLAQALDSLLLLCCSYIHNGGKAEHIVDTAGQKIDFDTLRNQCLNKMDSGSAQYRNYKFRTNSLQRTWLLVADPSDKPGEITGCWELPE